MRTTVRICSTPCQQRLGDAGFAQSKCPPYARAGARCRHNLNYWQFGDYLGIGAGAHGKRTLAGRAEAVGDAPSDAADERDASDPETTSMLRVERVARWREPRRYFAAMEADTRQAPVTDAAPAVAERRRVATSELPFEFLMNALRLREGFTAAQFEARTGLPVRVIADAWGRLSRHGTARVLGRAVARHCARLRPVERAPDRLPAGAGIESAVDNRGWRWDTTRVTRRPADSDSPCKCVSLQAVSCRGVAMASPPGFMHSERARLLRISRLRLIRVTFTIMTM